VQGIYFSLSYSIDTEGKVLQEFGCISPKKQRSVTSALAVYESSLRCLVSGTFSLLLPVWWDVVSCCVRYRCRYSSLSAMRGFLCQPLMRSEKPLPLQTHPVPPDPWRKKGQSGWRAGRDCRVTEFVLFIGPIPSLHMRGAFSHAAREKASPCKPHPVPTKSSLI
jgi:hypothetical protein